MGELRVAGPPLFTRVRSVGKVLLRKNERGLGQWKVNCHSKHKPFSHPGPAVTKERREMWWAPFASF